MFMVLLGCIVNCIKQSLLEEGVVCIAYNDAGVNKELTRRMRNILSVYLSIVYDRHAFKE